MMPTVAASSSLNRVHHSRDATKQVIWLTSRVDAKLPGVNYNIFTSLRELLAKHDISLKIKMIPLNCLTEPEAFLSDWLSKEPAHVYLLHGASEKMRLWFARNQLKAIIIGGKRSVEDYPAITVDIVAAGLDAIHRLYTKGHINQALIIPDSQLTDDQNLATAFRTNVHEKAPILEVSEDPDDLFSQLESLFLTSESESKSSISAIIIAHDRLGIGACTWLQHHDYRIPHDVSIVLLRSQPMMDFHFPSISHYKAQEKSAPKQVYSWIMNLIQSGACAKSHVKLMPQFVSGGSIADINSRTLAE